MAPRKKQSQQKGNGNKKNQEKYSDQEKNDKPKTKKEQKKEQLNQDNKRSKKGQNKNQNEDDDTPKRSRKSINDDSDEAISARADAKIKIMIEKKTKKSITTTLEWNEQNNPFHDIKNDIKKLKTNLSTSCSIKNNSLILNGDFGYPLKNILINEYHVSEQKIQIIENLVKIPKKFNITLIEKHDSTLIRWSPLKWFTAMKKYPRKINESYYKSFNSQFYTSVREELNLQINLDIDTEKNVEYSIQGNHLNELTDYFIQIWKIHKNQLVIESDIAEPAPITENNNSQIKDPLKEIEDKFSSFSEQSYFRKMSDTILDAYELEKQRLQNFIIKEQLTFIKSGSSKNKFTFWITSFDVSKKVTIEGIQAGRFISEGDDVLVLYKNRKNPFIGKVESIKGGIITAVFKINSGRYPPGYSNNAKNAFEEANDEDIQKIDDEEMFIDNKTNEEEEYDEDQEEEEEDQNDEIEIDENEEDNDDDNDNDDDFKDIYEEDDNDDSNNNDSNLPYTISFIPNDVSFQRCALGLLNLYNMNHLSSIKNILTKDKIDRSLNIIDESVDEEIDPNCIHYINLDITSPLEDSIEMILENQISIVHGPPGCGKTSSIALFVYHLLKKSFEEKKKILICAYSNQAVENIAKFVSPVVQKLGKKMVWIPKRSMCFENMKEFEEATEEQKTLSFYKILKRQTKEAKIFQQLQQKKWETASKMRKYRELLKIGRADPNSQIKPFPVSDQREMDQIQFFIEKNLIAESDVVCSTLISSARGNMLDFDFDYVFIDEASQANQMVSLIPLIHHPSKLVLLGDHRQLDAHVPDELKQMHPDTTKSLYKKLLLKNIQHVRLTTQFRMNPKIAEFPNNEFYDGMIKNADGIEKNTSIELEGIITPIMFVDVNDGNEKKIYGSTFINFKELETIEILLNNLKKNQIPAIQVGVITPYHGQVEKIRRIIDKLKYTGVKASSVDNFQGSERDFIILSLVRTNQNGNFGFLPNNKRINVSLTRARKGIMIVGNFNAFVSRNSCQDPRNQVLVDLCNFYEKNKAVVNYKSLKKIDVLIQKPNKNSKKLDIRVRNKPFKAKPKDENSNQNVRKVDKYADIIEYVSDDDDDDDQFYLS